MECRIRANHPIESKLFIYFACNVLGKLWQLLLIC